MELDARRIPAGARLGADVCVVGAGPAGLVVARELAGRGLDVLVLESGASGPEPSIQSLNEGEVDGDLDPALSGTRCRSVGGTAALWNTPVWSLDGHETRRGTGAGAKHVPLDPRDFEARPGGPVDEAWPFGYSALEPWYRRAQQICGLGRLAYGGEDWAEPRRPLLPLGGGRLSTGVYQFGRSDPFTRRLPGELRESTNVRLCERATVVRLELAGRGRRAALATVASGTGERFSVEARVIVLAAGAIENARLLLVSSDEDREPPGDRHGWVGRCFMEHPRDDALLLVPRGPDLFRRAAFYDAHAAPDGTVVGGRLVLGEDAVLGEGLPAASVSLFPERAEGARTWGGRGSGRTLLSRLISRLGRRPGRGYRGGYGWSRVPDPEAAFGAFRLRVNLEQRPSPENRVTLSDERDRLGVSRARVSWRWRPEEQAELERLRRFLADELERAGLGRVRIREGTPPDPDAHHHSGTTRMHADPRRGVVDPHGRVHGTDSLYVAGASVFPAAGFANPTLTIVALAARMADHLAERL